MASALAPPPADPVVSIALGDEHACGLTRGGRVHCWGRNYSGQLGDGTREDRARPVLVAIDQVAQVAAFGARTCAVKRDGTVFCWGSVGGLLADGAQPVFGQAGRESWDRVTPSPIAGLSGITQIALGGEHLCALERKGTVRCWGANGDGQLGDGTQVSRAMPTAIAGLKNVVELALGVSHSCALDDGGTVRCWGGNEGGQLGDRTNLTRTRPTAIPEFGGVAQLAVSGSSACARLGNGTVRCWGWNGHGQLGDGTTQNHPIPKAVYGLTGVREIVLGADYGCARSADGAVWCWGDNGRGQLGDPTRDRSLVPVKVPARGRMVALGRPGQIASGHACAVHDYGHVSCWGRNDHGQLGRGVSGARGVPAWVVWQP
jgi:alpha-tubulin suppressor-like RCC1 family protein